MKVVSFVGQQKDRADSIMGAFSGSSRPDHTFLYAGIAIAALLILFFIVSRANADQSKRR